MQVADGIHRLTRGVVNFYLIENGGKLALVDAGAPGDWGLLVRTVGSLGRTRPSGSTRRTPRWRAPARSGRTRPASADTSCGSRREVSTFAHGETLDLPGRLRVVHAPGSEQALRSLDELASLPADLIFPCHGEPWSDGVAEVVRLAKATGRS